MNATVAGVMSELRILIIMTEDKVLISNYCSSGPTKLTIHKWINKYIYIYICIYIYISVYKIEK